MNNINETLEKNSYKIVDHLPKTGEINLYSGKHLDCSILECNPSDKKKLRIFLNRIGYQVMVREKTDGFYQFILKN